MGRQEAVYELIDTEGDYVKDLGVVLDVHLRRLRESNLIQEAQIGQIFSNLPSIYTASSVRADGRDCVRRPLPVAPSQLTLWAGQPVRAGVSCGRSHRHFTRP